MNKVRKSLGFLLAFVMILAMAITANADSTYKLTITNTTTGHTYDVYQIYTGDLAVKDGNKVLSNVKYGVNYVPSGKSTGDAVPESELNAITDAEAFAKSIAPTGTAVKANVASAAGNTVIEGLAPGYYLVKETTAAAAVPEGETCTKYIVQVVGNAEVRVKSGTTSSDKKVKDTNDTTDATSDWKDSADYDIGDDVPFKLSATVASDYANYTDAYELIFHDEGCAGLTFNNDVVVKIDGTTVTTGYTVTASGNNFDVTFANLKNTSAVAGSVITVEYTAKLNEKAEIGSQGNINKSYIEYTNNAYTGQKGKTAEDQVIVFTYKVVADKYADEIADAKKLTGASFKLEKLDAEGTVIKNLGEINGEALSQFAWTGLDDGDYKITETVTPPGYNTIDPIVFTVSAEHSDGDTPALTSLSGDPKSGEAVTFTANKDAGTLSTDIINKSGAVLPTTGGMGTKLFYLIGAILVIGAGVLLIGKKRTAR